MNQALVNGRLRWPSDLSVSSLRQHGIVISVVVLFLLLSITSPNFLTTTNMLNILDQAAPVAVVAAGATLVIVGGSFDLSSGAIFAVAGITAAALTGPIGVPLAILVALLLGVGIGVLNGLVVVRLHVHSFLATLATSLIIRGMGLLIAGGSLVLATDSFRDIARTQIFGARSAVFIAVIFIVLCAALLAWTSFGRGVYAVGGNIEGARMAGLRPKVIQVGTFVVSGVAAALAGVLAASRVGGGQIGTGMELEFTAITAVVLGGTSIFGGDGSVFKSVVAVLLLTLIGNGFNLSGIDPVYQQFVVGGLLLTAIAIDGHLRRQDSTFAGQVQ